jgi:hypothetical protein
VAGSLHHSVFFKAVREWAVEVVGLLSSNAVGDSAWDSVCCRVFAVDERDHGDGAT